ncbi:tetratricopeptide repeat protein [Cyanobacteria bacterium 150SLHA]|uniref:tetratricopeptide repeat protein n=1 Tax=Prochlorococcus sp.P1363 TaxID=2729590 RepID=UPI00145E79AA|nr:tetratricopeptide repeat protein [Prochlorococcus sp.P1363]
MHRLAAITAALLMPVAIDGALLAEAEQAGPKVPVSQNNSSDKEALGIDNFKRLVKEAEQAEEAGIYQKAIEIWQQIIPIVEMQLGPEHQGMARILNNIAVLFFDQGLYKKAEPLYLRVLAIRKKALGAEHPDTAMSLNNLALLYYNQGLYSKAEPLYVRALAIREKASGAEHPDTATILNNLAWLHDNQGLYSKAEPLYLRALKINEKALGADHPTTASSLDQLALLYDIQGLYSKAEPLYLRALEIRKKALGADHPVAATSLNNLAGLYNSQGLYSKAEPLYLRALEIRKKALGADHPDTAMSLNNLAGLHYNQGLYNKAEPLYLRALAISEKALGPEHPDTAMCLDNLAGIYKNQGLYNKARPLHLRALAINEKALGADHPTTAYSLNKLALLYDIQGLYSKAEPLYLRALAIREKVLGQDHPDTATSLNNLAWLYEIQGLYSKAEPLYLRALAIREKVLGQDHPDTATSLNDLAWLHDVQGLYSKAEPFARRGLDIELTLMQRESPYLALSERLPFLQSFGVIHEFTFSGSSRGTAGANLALFARLNRQGLLEEIEKRQAQLAALPGPQQEIAEELRGLTQQLASMSLSPEQRQNLRTSKEGLEKQLYRLLPELEPRIVEVDQVANAIPSDGVLIEFQRYQPSDGSKLDDEEWGEARYLALVLKPNGEIESVDLGLAKPIEDKIQQALRASEERLADAQELWAEVGQLVVKPLAKATADADTWFISPDAELNRIPFAALSAPQGDQLLGEAVNLRLLTTGRELLDLAKGSKTAEQKPLVVANPNFDRGQTIKAFPRSTLLASNGSQQRSAVLGSQRWIPLPGTAKEGKAISELTDGQLLMGERATALAVQQHAAPKVLHMASHAYFRADHFTGVGLYLKNEAGDLVTSPTDKRTPAAKAGVLANDVIVSIDGNSTKGMSVDDAVQLIRGPEGTQVTLGLRRKGKVIQVQLIRARIEEEQTENPLLRSGIVLAGANQPNANSNDDGYLTALEVAKLDWQGTEMVVISGCESGKGEIQAGEGVYGLKRAIAVAGARSSLLSLWKVDDAATAAFMESFYERLKAGVGRADALAATQQEFREHKIPGWRHPYIWAAFQLSGDWTPISW